MKPPRRSLRYTVYILLLMGCLCLLQTGCVHSESELHNDLTGVFDVIFSPVRILTHQTDNVSDSIH